MKPSADMSRAKRPGPGAKRLMKLFHGLFEPVGPAVQENLHVYA